ncbi:MAG: BatA domain-containing protein [Planctomycetes bacterium]|nr:BatA domain-containing protein [Planctomycetota bacterium]
MQFLNPALLAGAALFAVPLIIHLLNRQRHKQRTWAAMEFLLRAFQKQKNRLRTENLLLLLLRCLLPILLALAIARPMLQAAAGLLAGAGTVHHVIVVDTSYSMGLRADGAQSPFERARALVGRLLDRFEQDPRRSDKVTLVSAGVRPRFLVRGDLDLTAARSQWLLLQKPEDAASDLGDALLQVADLLDEGGDPAVEVYVLSDLQARSFGKALQAPTDKTAPEFTDTLHDLVQRLQQRDGTRVHWIDTGPFADQGLGGNADNEQITDLRIEQPAAVLRTPVDFTAQLKNRGQAAATFEVTLEVDGGEPMRRVVAVPAGAEGEADFQVSFREAGRHRVRAQIQNDGLAADDERYLTVDVRDRIRVLLVDGAADEDPLRAYQYVWRMILDPDPAALPTFAIEAVDTLALLSGQRRPRDYDVTVLADVDRLNQRATQGLLEALRAGRGLLVAFGSRTDPESFNLQLHANGDGPQPFRVLQATGGSAGSSVVRTPVITAPDHPLFAEFEEPIYREVLQAIPVWRWQTIAPDSLREGATVLARLTDAEQSPLLVANPFGEGNAVFLTSAIASEYRADRWNRLDDPMVAFPLLHGLVKWLALPAVDPFLVPVGAELSCTLPVRPEEVQVQRPERDGRSRTPIGEDAQPLAGGRFRLPPVSDTVYAGFYVLDMVLDQEAGKEPLSLPFAVNVDPDEGDLRYAAHEEVRQALGLERVLDALPAIASADDDPRQNELAPSLLLLTLLLVLAEAALARFIAVRRS